MKINEIIKELRYFKGYFPKEALEQAIANKEDIIPELIKEIELSIANIEQLQQNDDIFGYLYAFYLLAQFREKKAFPLIVKFFTILEGDDYYFTGDIITEALDEILASVYDGNLSIIKEVIENKNIEEFIRSAFMDFLLILYKFDEITREELISYFRSLFNGRLEREHSYIWDNLIHCCAEIFAEELIDEINLSYSKGLINYYEVPRKEIIHAIKTKYYKYSELRKRKKIDNAIEEMDWWACFREDNGLSGSFEDEFDEPEVNDDSFSDNIGNIISDGSTPYKREARKIGRNESCPCGSGKKYKYCCGKKA